MSNDSAVNFRKIRNGTARNKPTPKDVDDVVSRRKVMATTRDNVIFRIYAQLKPRYCVCVQTEHRIIKYLCDGSTEDKCPDCNTFHCVG